MAIDASEFMVNIVKNILCVGEINEKKIGMGNGDDRNPFNDLECNWIAKTQGKEIQENEPLYLDGGGQ